MREDGSFAEYCGVLYCTDCPYCVCWSVGHAQSSLAVKCVCEVGVLVDNTCPLCSVLCALKCPAPSSISAYAVAVRGSHSCRVLSVTVRCFLEEKFEGERVHYVSQEIRPTDLGGPRDLGGGQRG